jgi:hypothetical protein
MKNLFLTLTLILGTAFIAFAQETTDCCTTNNSDNAKGDWYLGTGDLSNTSWTQWALTPTIGYAFTDDIMAGFSLNQGTTLDSTGNTIASDLNLDVHARYFYKGFFGYLGTQNLTTDFGLNVGVGKLFTTETNNLYLDPRVVYNTTDGTANLRIGFGLKF